MAVTPADVAVELGRSTPTPSETDRYQSWIDQALYLIEKRLGDVSLLDAADVDYVVLMAVAEHARNPESATQVSISVDDGSVSKSYTSGSDRVTIWDDLWAMLLPQGGVLGGAYSVPLGSPWSVP